MPVNIVQQIHESQYNLLFLQYTFSFNRDVTAYLRLLLRKEGFNFRSSSEQEIVRTIKEVSREFFVHCLYIVPNYIDTESDVYILRSKLV